VVMIAVPVRITVKVAGVPLNVTLVEPVRFFPRIATVLPTLPELGFVSRMGPAPQTG
jgi:hypothetical protein